MLRDIFGCHSWDGGLLLVSRAQRPGMLSHSLGHKGQLPTTKKCVAQNVSSDLLRNPGLNQQGTIYCSVSQSVLGWVILFTH